MVNLSKMNTTELLLFSKTALNNTKNTESIKNAMNEYGYDNKKIDEGFKLINETETLQEAQEQEYGKKYETSDVKKTAKSDAEKIYVKHVKLARLAFDNSAAKMRFLGINGKRATDLSGFLKEAAQFYNAALSSPEIQAGLLEYGISEDKLSKGKEAIENLITAYEKQQAAKANAEQSTQIRNEKTMALEEWMAKFIKVARIALEDMPQMLEALGITIK
jgi:hypothetical protein